MRIVNLIQFTNEPDNSFYCPTEYNYYEAIDLDDSSEMFMGEDDDGDGIYEDVESISIRVMCPYQNRLKTRHVLKDEVEYNLLEIELETGSTLFAHRR